MLIVTSSFLNWWLNSSRGIALGRLNGTACCSPRPQDVVILSYNISSGNEPYEQKLKSYANTLYWNETLREDTYKSKLDFRNFIQSEGLDFQALNTFGQSELESRHKLLFSLAKKIWG